MSAFYAKNETELPWPIELGPVYDKSQIGQWRDVINRIGLVYTEIETQMLGPIRPCAVYDEKQIGQ